MSPYEKILEAVEARQLDITTVSLAKITSDFVDYTRSLEKSQQDSGLLADFVAVAAKLLLIKSKVLLPTFELTEEEEESVKDLEERLEFYKQIKSAGKQINRLWRAGESCYSRPVTAIIAGFYPPDRITAQQLADAFKPLANVWEETTKETKIAKRTFVSVESKIKEIQHRLSQSAEQKFSSLLVGNSKGDIVASFLAMLHLLRDDKIKAEQKEIFGDITVNNL